MEYSGDRWVQRLRDGEAPTWWPQAIGLGGMTVVCVLVLVVEFGHPAFLAHLDDTRRGWSLVLLPAFLAVLGPFLIIASRVRGRQDRRVLTRIREHGGTPRFHLPVVTSTLFAGDAPGGPRPTMWTVDATGLQAWTGSRAEPVAEVPWARIVDIDTGTIWKNGQRFDYSLWILLDDGKLVLLPRSAIGRPYEASQTKLDILMRVLRSLRRELDRSGPGQRGTKLG